MRENRRIMEGCVGEKMKRKGTGDRVIRKCLRSRGQAGTKKHGKKKSRRLSRLHME